MKRLMLMAALLGACGAVEDGGTDAGPVCVTDAYRRTCSALCQCVTAGGSALFDVMPTEGLCVKQGCLNPWTPQGKACSSDAGTGTLACGDVTCVLDVDATGQKEACGEVCGVAL